MFGIFDGIQKAVENVIDVGVGALTMNEYGDFSKKTVSKMIADGIEIAVIAQTFNVAEEAVQELIKEK